MERSEIRGGAIRVAIPGLRFAPSGLPMKASGCFIPCHCLHEFQKDNQAAETEDQSHGDANHNHGRLSKCKIARHDILFLGRLGSRRAREDARA